jgi:hypothetical protein
LLDRIRPWRWGIAGLFLAVLVGAAGWGRGSAPVQWALRRVGLGTPSDPYDPTPAPWMAAPPADPALDQAQDLLPETVAALHEALDGLGIPWFIAQGISTDPLSDGTHRPDGRLARPRDEGANEAARAGYYSAAMDISIPGLARKIPGGACKRSERRAGRCLTDEENEQFGQLVVALRDAGFAAWYRNIPDHKTGIWEIEIHAIDPIAPYLKPSLRRQLDDYLRGRDGLSRHLAYDSDGRTILPNVEAFCARAARSGEVADYVPWGAGRTAYRTGACPLRAARASGRGSRLTYADSGREAGGREHPNGASGRSPEAGERG